MSDIFISYAREDRETAECLAAALQARGWSVWWDTRLSAGEVWDKVIARELAAARCVVVLWSSVSIEKHWVRVEAKKGLDRQILVPARIEAVIPPPDFDQVHAGNLIGWNGHLAHPGFTKVMAAIANKLRAPWWKRILPARTVAFLTAIILALLLAGWDQPLKHFYSPSALTIRWGLHSPPPVASPVKPSLRYHGHRTNHTAVRLDHDASKRFEMDTGIEIIIDPHDQDDRLPTLRDVFKRKASDFDVIMIDIIWAGELADHLINVWPFFENELKSFDNTIIENITIEGNLVAVPWFQNIGLLFYRKDLLDDYDDLEVPLTWEDLEEAAKKIQKTEREKGKTNFYGYAWQGQSYEGLTCNALEWFASEGALDAETGLPDFDQPGRLEEALHRAWRWLNEDNAISRHATGHKEWESLDMFRNGNAAFYRGWSNDYALLKQSGIDFGVAPLPRGSVEQNFSILGGWQLAVPKYSLNQRSAIEFIRYKTSPEIQEWRARRGSFQPTIRNVDVQDDLPYLEDPRISDIQLIIRLSDRLGNRYNSVSRCIYTSVFSALSRNSRDDIGKDIVAMENCIIERASNGAISEGAVDG